MLKYHQLRIDDKGLDLIRTRYCHYGFRIMSFGLTNAPAIIMDLMNKIFHEFRIKFVIMLLMISRFIQGMGKSMTNT